MVWRLLLFLNFSFAVCSSQTWVSRAQLAHHREYWYKMMDELMLELEARQWCNLELIDITQAIDLNIYNLHVNGTVHYTNGFVVSVQKITIVDVEQSVTSRTIDGESVPSGMVRGKINFNDIKVGYDVFADLTSPKEEYRTTGTFVHPIVQIQVDLNQNLITKEFSSSPTVLSVRSTNRMEYLPASNITEVLSRQFSANTFESAANWGRNIFAPIVIDLATNKLGYPELCFSNCS